MILRYNVLWNRVDISIISSKCRKFDKCCDLLRLFNKFTYLLVGSLIVII